MPRKKSVGGRKRTDLTTNYLLERANKKLVNLERANLSVPDEEDRISKIVINNIVDKV